MSQGVGAPPKAERKLGGVANRLVNVASKHLFLGWPEAEGLEQVAECLAGSGGGGPQRDGLGLGVMSQPLVDP